jgi:hypothetical protein
MSATSHNTSMTIAGWHQARMHAPEHAATCPAFHVICQHQHRPAPLFIVRLSFLDTCFTGGKRYKSVQYVSTSYAEQMRVCLILGLNGIIVALVLSAVLPSLFDAAVCLPACLHRAALAESALLTAFNTRRPPTDCSGPACSPAPCSFWRAC